MAIHKAKVIGQLEVNGTAPGGTTDLDDEQVNIPALVRAGVVEIVPPAKKAAKKAEEKGTD